MPIRKLYERFAVLHEEWEEQQNSSWQIQHRTNANDNGS